MVYGLQTGHDHLHIPFDRVISNVVKTLGIIIFSHLFQLQERKKKTVLMIGH
jgi:hypothetical protein